MIAQHVKCHAWMMLDILDRVVSEGFRAFSWFEGGRSRNVSTWQWEEEEQSTLTGGLMSDWDQTGFHFEETCVVEE